MKTSAQWWDEVRQDPDLLNNWLAKQYRGEVTAAARIRKLADMVSTSWPSDSTYRLLNFIADQEEQHAEWVAGLLLNRGFDASTIDLGPAEDRYWDTVGVNTDHSFEITAAIGAHAEAMRLERIRAIVQHPDTPVDIEGVFLKILKDEVMHESAFRHLAGPEAMDATSYNAEQGRIVLGLEA